MKRPVLTCQINRSSSGASLEHLNSRGPLQNDIAGRRLPEQGLAHPAVAASKQGEELLPADLDRRATSRITLPLFVEVAMFRNPIGEKPL
jgi:hypothetical protein